MKTAFVAITAWLLLLATVAQVEGACENSAIPIGNTCCWGYPWDIGNASCDAVYGPTGDIVRYRGFCPSEVGQAEAPVCTACNKIGQVCCGPETPAAGTVNLVRYACECFKNSDCDDKRPCTSNLCVKGLCKYPRIKGCGPVAPLYGQCGGKLWKGSKLCAAGSVCKVQNEWYSQCLKP